MSKKQLKKENKNEKELCKLTELLRSKLITVNKDSQMDAINKDSPYSGSINKAFSSYSEFNLYYSLKLKEAKVTRVSLIKDIDLNLYVSHKKCTNRELMLKGRSPYAYDSENGKIELHHISQKYNGPFAELTVDEHSSFENNKILHISSEESWRTDKKLVKAFKNERSKYWKQRVKGDFVILSNEQEFKPLDTVAFEISEKVLNELKSTIEEIFNVFSVKDLDFASDLAKSFSLMKEIKVNSISEFIESIRKNKGENQSIQCPKCGFEEYTRYGSYNTQTEKIQRFKCKKCDNVFTTKSNSLVSGSNFSLMGWIRFIDAVYNGHTLKQIASYCKISEQTAHENRLKLFSALKILDDKVILNGNVVIDETYLPLSFKGNHTKQEGFILNRVPHKRGKDNLGKGLNENQVCIVCAMDDDGNSVAHVAGVKSTSFAKVKYALNNHISPENVSCIYSDKAGSIRCFAEHKGIEIKQEKQYKKGTKKAANVVYNKSYQEVNRYIQKMNSYHSRLKKFVDKFLGTSSELLQGYLYLFAWKERNKDIEPIEAYKELLAIMTEPNLQVSLRSTPVTWIAPDSQQEKKKIAIKGSKNFERNQEIYKKYADGQTIKELASEYNLHKNTIDYIIVSFRKNGMAYRTKKEIEDEEKSKIIKNKYENNKTFKRNKQIYDEKQNWTGSCKEFYDYASQKYNLSTRRIKSVILEVQKVNDLKHDIFIYDDIEYKTLKQLYTDVYNDYLRLTQEHPEFSNNKKFIILAEEHKLEKSKVYAIISLMNSAEAGTYFDVKRKTPVSQVLLRDKAVFVDCLRWTGSRADFLKMASEKYKVSKATIYHIIKLCKLANPKRNDMV